MNMIHMCYSLLSRLLTHEASFFFTEFQPNSPTVKSAGLVSPESMVLQGNRILYQLDAMWNMVEFGFTDSRQCGDDQGSTFSNVSFLHVLCILSERADLDHFDFF